MPLRNSIIHERLLSKQAIHCFKSNFPTVLAPQVLGSCGMDCLWFDQEHLATDLLTMSTLVLSAHAVDADAVVRVPNGCLADAVRMLDAGADAIMYPRVRRIDEVEKLVQYLRFSPIGSRGMDTMVPSNFFGTETADNFAAYSNDQNQIIIQIETREALDKVDEIAQVAGINILFVGISDLARELGVNCDPQQARLIDAFERVSLVARKHGLAWGTPALSIEHAADLLKAGAQFISHGSDSSLLKAAVSKIRNQLNALGIKHGRD